MKRGLLLKLSPSCFYTGCASRDGGQIVADILQGVRQSKSVDESGGREDKTMKMITGLLVIVAGAIVFNTASAVPRYSVSVPQVGDSNVTHPATESAGVLAQNQKSPVLQRIKQEAQMCNSPQPYVTCAYMRPLDAPVVGKVAEATLGEKGVHWQIVIYNAKTGEQIASYGKTTTPIVQGSSAAGLVAAGAVGAIAGALEGTAYGQGIMTHDDPTNNPEYATYRQEPVWCIGSSEISVLKPGYYEVLNTDCREYAERVKDDLLRNKGGREIPAPEYTILSTSCRKGDMSKRETESTKSKSNDVSDDSEKKSVVPEQKTVSNRVGVANSMSSAAADSGVGVRGWCHCWEHEPPGQGVLLSVGEENLAVGEMNDLESAEFFRDEYGATQRCSGKYSYTICSHCGKCYTSQKVGDSYDYNGGGELTDAVIFNKWYDKAGSEIPTQEYFRMQQVSRDKLLAVPDGHVVIPGKCDCKYPDPVSVALKADEFYVCCFCGRVRLPDKSGGIPIGPTTWRYMMGDKPFPGFQGDKRGR